MRIPLIIAVMVAMTITAAIHARAATINASSTSLADVTTAIGLAAAAGDTIQLPAGASSWSGGIATAKCFTLLGAGTNNTILTRVNGLFLTFQPTVDNAVIRVSGITFSNSVGATASSIEIDGKTSAGSGPLVKQFRIDRCKFLNGTRAVLPYGGVYGLIDYNYFGNCNIAIGPIGNDNWSWNQQPIERGTTNSLYIESNTFVINNSVSSEPNQQIYHQGGARSVTRFNTFDGSSYTLGNSIWFDSHGNFPNGGTDFNSTNQTRGQPIIEKYGNTHTSHHTYLMDNARGGSWLVYSNTWTYLNGTAPDAWLVTEEESWDLAVFNPLRTIYPAMDQVTNSFFWSNTLNGSTAVIADNHAQDAAFIQLNRDYWLQPPNATNGSPAGVYNGYTRLTYPHPMAIVQDVPVSAPGAGNSKALLLLFYPDGSMRRTNGTVTLPPAPGAIGQMALVGEPNWNAIFKSLK